MPRRKRKRPIDWVVEQFGSVQTVAQSLGVTTQAVYRWKNTTFGKIPCRHYERLLQEADSYGLDVTLNDVVLGR